MQVFKSLGLSCCFILMATQAVASETLDKKVAYYTAWSTYGRDFQVKDIHADALTHINYAFANVQNGQCVLGDSYADVDKHFTYHDPNWEDDNWNEPQADFYGNFKQLKQLKAKYPGLKTLISVGGWTWSKNFAQAASTDESRALFAKSCTNFMEKYDFDGIDIDWEFPVVGPGESPYAEPKPEEKANFVALLKALRTEMNQRATEQSKHYLLTIATAASLSKLNDLDLPKIAKSVDFVNLMSYDFHGGWDKQANHNAPLYQNLNSPDADLKSNIADVIQAYISAGLPRHQLVMGLPFYGRSFAQVEENGNQGLFGQTTGSGPGTWEKGFLDYADIVDNYLNKPEYQQYDDTQAAVPWLYSPTEKVMVSYDDPKSISKKIDYVKTNDLAGVMIWELSSDIRAEADQPLPNNSLLKVIADS